MTVRFFSRKAANVSERLALRAADRGQGGLGEVLMRAAARIDLADQELQQGWGGPMNGQIVRQRTVEEIIEQFAPAAIVECGTFRAVTTLWFAEIFRGPVFTCEVSRRHYLVSAERLRSFANVTIEN